MNKHLLTVLLSVLHAALFGAGPYVAGAPLTVVLFGATGVLLGSLGMRYYSGPLIDRLGE